MFAQKNNLFGHSTAVTTLPGHGVLPVKQIVADIISTHETCQNPLKTEY
jgi:hypothetical protein